MHAARRTVAEKETELREVRRICSDRDEALELQSRLLQQYTEETAKLREQVELLTTALPDTHDDGRSKGTVSQHAKISVCIQTDLSLPQTWRSLGRVSRGEQSQGLASETPGDELSEHPSIHSYFQVELGTHSSLSLASHTAPAVAVDEARLSQPSSKRLWEPVDRTPQSTRRAVFPRTPPPGRVVHGFSPCSVLSVAASVDRSSTSSTRGISM
eukprot:Sspe_Gene.93986::Locus_66474_Transcript_1_1_Confidence_1.000_Length_642::g.93986::m.93986